jgi:hypothetical protein
MIKFRKDGGNYEYCGEGNLGKIFFELLQNGEWFRVMDPNYPEAETQRDEAVELATRILRQNLPYQSFKSSCGNVVNIIHTGTIVPERIEKKFWEKIALTKDQQESLAKLSTVAVGLSAQVFFPGNPLVQKGSAEMTRLSAMMLFKSK